MQKASRVCQVIQAIRGVQVLKGVQELTAREVRPVDRDRRVKGETLDPPELRDHKDLLEKGVILEIVVCPDPLVNLVPRERPEVMDHVD